MVIHTTFVIKL